MNFSRAWAMPNKNTFSIKPVSQLIEKHNNKELLSIDPFANTSRVAKVTNDIDWTMGTDFALDALSFLRKFEDDSVDLVFFDPPYSPRQVSECYKALGLTVSAQDTQSKFWGDLKKEIARVTKTNGKVISFGWNSNGIGKTKGFEIIEILTVAHGGNHNDTICTVEIKKAITDVERVGGGV